MFRFTILSVVLSWSVLVFCEFHCPSKDSPALKFSITSHRNLTGHWIAQVQLEHQANQKDRETGPWQVDIDHTTTECENLESIIIVASVTAPPKRPGSDYELVPGLGYYKFHTKAKTFQEARELCAQEGTHLVIPNSQAEVDVLQSIWGLHPNLQNATHQTYVFVGFHDIYKEGEYITIFGQPLESTGYAKWHGTEPSNVRSENCGSLFRGSAYNDISCAANLAFFCEQEL